MTRTRLMRLRRSQPGWRTLERVARLMSTPSRHVSKSALGRFEQGEGTAPDEWFILRYALALGLQVAQVEDALPACWRQGKKSLDRARVAAS